MPLLIGAAGLAVDTTNWTYWKRQLQREADSAALAGAFAKLQGMDVAAAATSDLARTNVITLSAPASIQNAPITGSFAGDPLAVRVALSTQKRLPFSGSFMSSVPIISAHATAKVLQFGDYCLGATASGSAIGITMMGSATLDFNCSLYTNSTNQAKAVIAGGSALLNATSITASGGISGNNYSNTTQLSPYSPPQPDPYASVPSQTPSGSCTAVNVPPNQTKAVPNPTGITCIKNVNLSGTVTFSPGTYVVDGGSFDIGSKANVSIDASVPAPNGDTGVTFILTSSTGASDIAYLNINAGATINLTASTKGTYAGILFYQDRNAQDIKTNTINGNASTFFQGAFYFPSQEIKFNGTSGVTWKCMQLVGLRFTFSGSTKITNECPAGSGASSWHGVQVKLVE
jgi:hypothetical protein